ncbi:32226_t:CDS:2, partial [Racocetra persica]
MPRSKKKFKQRQHLKNALKQRKFYKKENNVAKNIIESTSGGGYNVVNIESTSDSHNGVIDNSIYKDIPNISDSSHNSVIENTSNSSYNDISNISTSSRLPNIEIDIRQQKVDRLLEYAIDLPDSFLTTFINIIKKVSQEQFRQQQYLKTWDLLLNMAINMDDNELSLGVSLINLMRYSKGPKTGKVFSKYLQQKAYDFIEESLYRPKICLTKSRKPSNRKVNRLTKKNKSLQNRIRKYKQMHKKKISLARSAARKKPTITNKQLKLAIQDRLMINKKQYSAGTVSMATQVCEIGEMSYRSAITCTKKVIEWLINEEPDKWFSVSTLVGWHKDTTGRKKSLFRKIHFLVLEQFKDTKKISKTYLEKWELLWQWLMDPYLKIQVECLAKFEERIYELMMNFFIGFDKEPWVLQPDGKLSPLLPGRRAHEMSDAFIKWIRNLYSIRDNVCLFFDTELWDAIDILDDKNFGQFFNNLELGIDKAINSLDNWMSVKQISLFDEDLAVQRRNKRKFGEQDIEKQAMF